MERPVEDTGLTVLIAERHRTVAGSLARIIESTSGARVTGAAATAEEAIELGGKLAPDVAIIDLDLSPNCSLVRGLHALAPETRIIVLADREGEHSNELVNALASGAVGAIYKEASMEELVKALTTASASAPVVAQEAAGLLLGSYVEALTDKRRRDLATIEALAAAVEVRDVTTGLHLDRVTKLARSCLVEVDAGLAHNEEVAYGFTLHDIGKIGVPDGILNKPGPLDDGEWDVMRQHPEMGCKIVEPLGFSDTAIDVIMCHHERWDGSGYPNGLVKDEIPITARVFSVADCYDAMTSDRPYRSAMEREKALAVLERSAGETLDPDVVDVFIRLPA